jgi:hypothetical protein
VTNEILNTRLVSPTVWYAKDAADEAAWLRPVSPEDQLELLAALQVAKDRRCTIENISKVDFPLPGYSKKLRKISRDIDERMGFCVLRGIPTRDLSLGDIELLYAGLTSHLGSKINQDTQGTLIDHVRDRGLSYTDIRVRGYTTNAELTPHCDSGDLVGLLCVRPAKEGGMNNISCSMAVFNELVGDHPEYLEPLFRGFYYNIRGNGPIGEYQDITSHRVPVYSYHKSMLSCRYNQKAILTAEELPNSERLTDLEKAAINCVGELAMREDIRFDARAEAGDLMLLNNHTVFHNRDGFTDYPEPERKRLLLRQWINLEVARELTFEFADHYNTGPRMGPAIHHGKAGERVR